MGRHFWVGGRGCLRPISLFKNIDIFSCFFYANYSRKPGPARKAGAKLDLTVGASLSIDPQFIRQMSPRGPFSEAQQTLGTPFRSFLHFLF